ncbi:amidohydrolase family protein [Roseivirga sp. E12]|uniref:amidohydrolase family protein n=1 Tax=Roseivirga sp. E12 TaxID=2819237 RepID=UPI001ABC8EBE|nr:amidohydrolase family protein [Roseivirga sp. E12]MBO3697157.1 amidohydrolase family protein [Roseivirga sp. E12]
MLRLHLVLLLSFTVLQTSLFAQSDPTGTSAVTTTYAITNATVITKPGSEMKGATVVVKNGLIIGVGTNVSIPDDAEVIDASGLYVYPAFIDGMSNTGAKRPDNLPRPQNLFTPDPPNDYAGITPENSVLSQIDIKSSSITNMRKVGFAISHSVPYGRMLPGSGSLIVLNEATHMDEIVMAKDVALYAQWVGAPGAYPGNILGIMAKWRNLYRNAENHKNHTELYAQNPAGLPRPVNDRVSLAFHPVIGKSKPVMFDVSSMLDVRRAMRLQNDLGFNLMLSGVKQAWDLVDELKASGTPIFLSLDLPDEPKDSKSDDKSDEVKSLEARRMEFYKTHVGQAAALQAAGVKFGFSARGASASKIKKNVMTLIENGLSADDALAALTTNPASMLGIDQVTGSVESGKMANLMVSTAPYFTKDSQIKMMFVDGTKHVYDVKEKKAKKDDSATEEEAPAAAGGDALVGTWIYELVTPGEPQGGKMIIKKEDGKYTGVLTSNDGTPDNDMNNINFRDGELTFDFDIDAGGQSVTVVVEGSISGTEFDAQASVSVGGQSFELGFTATKDGK